MNIFPDILLLSCKHSGPHEPDGSPGCYQSDGTIGEADSRQFVEAQTRLPGECPWYWRAWTDRRSSALSLTGKALNCNDFNFVSAVAGRKTALSCVRGVRQFTGYLADCVIMREPDFDNGSICRNRTDSQMKIACIEISRILRSIRGCAFRPVLTRNKIIAGAFPKNACSSLFFNVTSPSTSLRRCGPSNTYDPAGMATLTTCSALPQVTHRSGP